ncbi:N-methyltryptophan oxidase [Paenibacillus glycanilyticus]|uniref:N-methyltryptophan oxidase n=1 Tax=Paenibacillus glycanilyticus TaxID=126569 RepID=A0ABQ6NN58_9BACL|nr:N-methyl-L-tryptophan oxidase [Paenibacillus glycanilyticus]GMK45970.1 N-methyltryptophan oxidase [Paenibacillus glycanilyticus]
MSPNLKKYDVIVVGAGSMGISAGYELARRGAETLLIDAFDPPHGEGSHHGEPRLIRHAYSGGSAYISLAIRADEKWLQLEEATGLKLLERAGVLNIADTDVYDFRERQNDAESQGVTVEWLTGEQIRKRWPNVKVSDNFQGMYEPYAGYLYSEKAVAAYKQEALRAGAQFIANTFVTGLRTEKDGSVTVHTKGGSYQAERVILSAGAWFKMLQPFLFLPIRSVRKVVGWFETVDSTFDSNVFPGFTIGTKNGGFYGFPSIDGAGVKIGRHDGGVPWEPGKTLAPFGAYPEDEEDLRQALESYLPGATGKLLRGAVCKYELTPDEDFIIDHHPLYKNVVIAGGFSGHGFKFASAIGEVLADLALNGRTSWDISPFRLSRFAS